MKRTVLSVVSFCIPLANLFGQSVVGDVQGKGLDIQTGSAGYVTQLPPAPAETKGDVYLNSEWSVAEIILYNKQVKLNQYPVRIDLKANEIELNVENQTKILAGNRVQRIRLTNNQNGGTEHYINARNYKLNGVPMTGFIKVIDSAKWQLLIKPQIKLVKANYVAALDAGERSDKWVKEEVLFFAKGNDLYQVFSSGKKFSNQFADNAGKISTFIKSNKIDLKNLTDLITLQRFLNEEI